MSNRIPSFGRPPVVETLLGVEFSPIPNWNVVHFGLFWNLIREEFPRAEVQPPLSSVIESFEPARPRPRKPPTIALMMQPDIRCWFVSQDDRSLLQLQSNRFIVNWRRGESDAEYPRYEAFVRPLFERNWSRFSEFLSSEGIESPDVIQCEVTYVNHLLQGEGWDSLGDWSNVFRPLSGMQVHEFLPSIETGKFNFNYAMPKQSGRLRVNADSAIRDRDAKPIINFQLSARGKPASSSRADILSWLDLGREWIVRGFTDLTTDAMHRIWQREDRE